MIVEGYQQEPYLRFRTDGVVEENQRSPTTYLNANRYGGDDVPAGADADAAAGLAAGRIRRPVRVARPPGPRMERGTPADGAPGEQVQTATVAMTVNGDAGRGGRAP